MINLALNILREVRLKILKWILSNRYKTEKQTKELTYQKKWSKYTQLQQYMIIKVYHNTKSIKEISKKYNLSTSSNTK